MTRIGLISDTHGLLRPQAIQFLMGSRMIIHCGDICGPEILTQLARIAPVTAVRGNNDTGAWAEKLPEHELLTIGKVHVYVIHDLSQMAIDPAAAGINVVLSGHSHRAHIERRDGVLYVNPGSAGSRRFKLGISAAELIISEDVVTPRLVEFEQHPPS